MFKAHKWLGWVAAGAIGGAALVGGALAAPVASSGGGPAPGAADRPFGPAREVLQQIHAARPQLTEQQKQEWLAKADQILAAAVKDGKLTQAQADAIRAQVAAGNFGFKGKGAFMGSRGRGFHEHGFGPGGFKDLTPEQRQQKLDQLKARLDEQVKAGKLTQAQADAMLKRFTDKLNRSQNSQ